MVGEKRRSYDNPVNVRFRPVTINTLEGRVHGRATRLGDIFNPTTVFEFPSINQIYVRRKGKGVSIATVVQGTCKGMEISQNNITFRLTQKNGRRSLLKVDEKGVAIEGVTFHSERWQRNTLKVTKPKEVSAIDLPIGKNCGLIEWRRVLLRKS